jgi:hypothetical protein
LRVSIGGRNLTAIHPVDTVSVNVGNHKILTGGRYDSHLLVPVASEDLTDMQ